MCLRNGRRAVSGYNRLSALHDDIVVGHKDGNTGTCKEASGVKKIQALLVVAAIGIHKEHYTVYRTVVAGGRAASHLELRFS
jgi:hypothetical protein